MNIRRRYQRAHARVYGYVYTRGAGAYVRTRPTLDERARVRSAFVHTDTRPDRTGRAGY